MPFNVMITDRFDVEAEAKLRSSAGLVVTRSAQPLPTSEELANVEALVIRSRTKIDSALLSKAPNLKAIVTATSGFDHLDLNETSKRGLKVMYTPEANAASAAEFTWALVLATVRKIPQAHRAVKTGDWKREALMGRQLSGLTYGVIGLGRIGTRVARIAHAFGMSVVAFDPYKEESYFARENCTRMSLDEVFKNADVVSCHVPGTEETHHMIRRLALAEAGHDIVFVNTSRGSVIEEHILVEALEKGWFVAAGLDVFEREPLARTSHLVGRDNVVMSPHVGATTHEAFRAASLEAATKIVEFARTGAVTDPLPPDEPWMAASFAKSSD
ncbi:MAG: NAD(P)-dependent oxidoreductase [Bdellovibrionota bacterium]